MVTEILAVGIVGTIGTVVVALIGWSTGKANRTETRLDTLWERVDKLEDDLDDEREYTRVLIAHINAGKPPPPPPRP